MTDVIIHLMFCLMEKEVNWRPIASAGKPSKQFKGFQRVIPGLQGNRLQTTVLSLFMCLLVMRAKRMMRKINSLLQIQ